jgi:hypothetical protein
MLILVSFTLLGAVAAASRSPATDASAPLAQTLFLDLTSTDLYDEIAQSPGAEDQREDLSETELSPKAATPDALTAVSDLTSESSGTVEMGSPNLVEADEVFITDAEFDALELLALCQGPAEGYVIEGFSLFDRRSNSIFMRHLGEMSDSYNRRRSEDMADPDAPLALEHSIQLLRGLRPVRQDHSRISQKRPASISPDTVAHSPVEPKRQKL